jgi:uncharacterized membrane protein (DUF4010 family)
MELIKAIPKDLVNFVLVTVFSLLIGLSQRKVHMTNHGDEKTFGTDRTFTFIGILGYLLYILEPQKFLLFIVGGGILAGLFMIYYYYHLKHDRDYGITTVVIGLITYCLGPLIILQPSWLVLVVLITVLVVSESKAFFISFSEKISKDEFFTLAKFLVIAGVVLPLVPDTEIYPGFSLTPYKIWLAVVVISSISYASYLLKKFFVKKNSILISGILGGMYSSTATTVILSKRSKKEPSEMNQYAAAIMFATGMMYLRVMVLILIFNLELFFSTWYLFVLLFVATALSGLAILFFRNRQVNAVDNDLRADTNPLEFRTALVFTLLFVILSVLTHAVINRYGTTGLNLMSYLVGLVDIDPFLISLFAGKFDISTRLIIIATLQAMVSNNIVKLGYALFFGSKKAGLYLTVSFLFVILLNFLFILIL